MSHGVRVDNPYWRELRPGGYLIKINSNNSAEDEPVKLNYAISSRATIDVGDPVCLSARYVNWGDSCGTVTKEFDGYGRVEVCNYDACDGASGGAWVSPVSGGYWGFGVHDSSRAGCPVLDGGGKNSSRGYSNFSSIPDINRYWDKVYAPVRIRIDYRQ